MKKLIFTLGLLFSVTLSWGQITENFDNWSDTSYGEISTYTDGNGGEWETNNGMSHSDNARSGNAIRFNYDSGENEYLLYKGTDGNGKDNGIGDISFWYRHWDGDGSGVQFQVQYNQSGSGWTNVGGVISVSSTTYTEFTETVNLSGDDILIKIISIDDNERLLIDDLTVTDYANTDPTLTVSTSALTGFTYADGNGPSTSQTFTLSGSNLDNSDVSLSAPTNYEISDDDATFVSSITLTAYDGTDKTIYVRLKAGLSVGDYNGESISISGGGDADGTSLTCDGTVTAVCETPTAQATDLTFSNIAQTTLDGSFTAASPAADGYLVVRSDDSNLDTNPSDATTYNAGDTLGNDVVVQASNATSFSDSNLTQNTTYYYFVLSYNNSDCSGGPMYNTTSPLSGNVTTLVDPCATAQSLTYTQGFENSGSIPDCWSTETVTDSDSDTEITFETSTSHPSGSNPDEGSYLVRFNSNNCDAGDEMRLVSPILDTSGLSNIEVDFAWFEDDQFESTTEGVKVQWSTDGTTWNDATFYQRYNSNGDAWSDKKCILPSGADNQSQLYVAFLFHSELGNDCYIDDVIIKEASPEINFNITSTTVTEDSTTFDIQVNSNITGSHTVDIIVNGGDASNGTEFSFTSPTQATFDSSTTFTTSVTINNDNDCGGNHNVIFELSNPSTGTTILADNQLDLSITDDEMETGEHVFARFEGSDTWNYTITGTGAVQDSYNHNDAYSIRMQEDAVVDFDDVNIGGFTDVTISVAYASYQVDTDDDLYMDISYDGGANYTESIELINGFDDFDLAINATNGDRTPQDTNPYTFNVPADKTSVKIRFRSTSTLVDSESFYIDDVILSRTTCNACVEPTTDASFYADSPDNLTDTAARLNWTSGDGGNRIVVMKASSAISFEPVDNSSYTANSAFGSGTDVGTGEYVVYNGNSNTVDVTNLTPGTEYFTKIWEYGCSAGSEDYFTSGTPTTDVFITTPDNPNTFNEDCVSNTTMDLSWTAPANGDFDGYLLVVRENAVPESVNSLDPSTNLNDNLDYTAAATYGTDSKILYKGTDLSATVTDLTQGTSYTFKIFTYKIGSAAYKYATGTQTSQTIALPNVSGETASSGNTEAEITWTNPDIDCYDEILVVANETSGISFTPSGDGSAYTADTAYAAADQVVFKGAGNAVTTTNLTNGTTYYFEIFVRKGTQWSSGVEVAVTPNTATVLEQGDLAIIAVNTQYNSDAGGLDEVCFVAFKDINTNTAIDFTDNGYERLYADLWGDTEGTIRLKYTGTTTISAGTVICFQGQGSDSDDFSVIKCGSDDSANWDISSLGGGTTSYNMNADDQIWIMQNGSWSNPYDDHNATYTGNVLYGWTATGWEAAAGYDDTAGSTIFNQAKCFSTDVSGVSYPDKVKYNGDPTVARTQKGWLQQLNNPANWVGYDTNSDYDAGTNDYSGSCITFNISGTGFSDGLWTGTKDENWFECGNWDDLRVPDQNTNVTIPETASTYAIIDADATDSDLYDDVAETNNLIVESNNLIEIKDSDDILKVHGNLTINTDGGIDMDGDSTTEDGKLYLYGDWTNNAGANGFYQGQSTVYLLGNTPQNISRVNNETEEFYNLDINNAQGITFASGDIHAIHNLTITANTPITISDGHYLLAGNALENNVAITVENQGALVQTNDAGSISGTGTFQLNKTSLPLNNYWEYVYWSSPINSSAFTMEGIVSGAWRYYKFDPNEANNRNTYPGWVMLSATDTPAKGIGYAISAPTGAATNTILNPQFISGNDPFNNGEITINILKKGGPDNIGDFNLLGNPYPSAIDFHALIDDADNSNLVGAYSLWTNCEGLDANGHHQDSGYTTYSYSGGSGTQTAACSGSGSSAGRYIATGQGFMIEASTDNSTMKFKNAYRVTNNNDGFLNRNLPRNIVWVDMLDGNGKFNQIAVGFYPNATDAYDRLFDASSMNTGNGYALYSILGNKKLAIQGLPELSGTDKVIPLGVESDIARTITLHINHTEGLANEYIYVRDLYLNIIHDLKASDYTTTVNTGNIDDRFELIFTQQAMRINDVIIDPNAVLLTQQSGAFNLSSNNDMHITSVTVYDITGKMLYNNKAIDATSHQIDLQRIASGNMLLFRVQMNNESIVVKKAIKQ